MRRSTAGAALGAALLLGACDAPTVPPRVGFYDPAQASDVVFHWPVGTTIDVFVAPSTDPVLDAAIERAASIAIREWNAAALFGEYRLQRAGGVASAEAVLRWSSTPSPVEVPRETATCNPDASAAHTVFCWVTDSDPMRLITMPTPGGAATDVRVVVTVLAGVDTAQARRLFLHEVGHIVGVWGHSPDPDDVMHSSAAADALTEADEATVQVLYRMPSEVLLSASD